MRKFYIKNEAGTTYQLDNSTGIFLNIPQGLGFANTLTYAYVSGRYLNTLNQPTQGEITGVFVFTKNQYTNYATFTNFLTTAKKLVLGYAPNGTYYEIDVDIRSVGKTEITPYRWLECPVSIAAKSMWYPTTDTSVEIKGTKPTSFLNEKRYNYRYDYRYTASTTQATASANFTAEADSDFRLVFSTRILGPYITFTRTDTSETLGIIDMRSLTISAGETATFSTIAGEAGLFLTSGGNTTDLTTQLGIDSEYETFFRLPPAVPITVTVSSAGAGSFTVTLYIRRYYRTV